jgi:hypothetical protein
VDDRRDVGRGDPEVPLRPVVCVPYRRDEPDLTATSEEEPTRLAWVLRRGEPVEDGPETAAQDERVASGRPAGLTPLICAGLLNFANAPLHAST